MGDAGPDAQPVCTGSCALLVGVQSGQALASMANLPSSTRTQGKVVGTGSPGFNESGPGKSSAQAGLAD